MNKRFILLVDDATREQQDAVTNYLRTTKYGFWHLFSDAWLLNDRTDTANANALRDELNRLVPGKTTLVVPMDEPSNWAGFGQTEQFTWLRETWNAP